MKRYLDFLVSFGFLLFCLAVGFLFGTLLGTLAAHADTSPRYKIAIIDTGYVTGVNKTELKLCKTGHFNFKTGQHEIGPATLSHGTMVGGIIAAELKDMDYCAVIYTISVYANAEQIIMAFNKASYETVDAINASYNGYIKSVAEREAVRDATKRVNAVFVAAGNEGLNLDYECSAFPTCFDIEKMHPVGALDLNGKRLKRSNYGSRVKEWFSGECSLGWLPATSCATPRALASYVHSLEQKRTLTVQTTKTPLKISATPTTSTRD